MEVKFEELSKLKSQGHSYDFDNQEWLSIKVPWLLRVTFIRFKNLDYFLRNFSLKFRM